MGKQNKKIAFTLIETIIAITLFMLVVMFLYNAIDKLKNENELISNKVTKFNQNEQLVKVLFLDIFEAKDVAIKTNSKNQNIDKITLTTKNSLYHNYYPKIEYFVNKDNFLIRKESNFEDNITKAKIFKVYKSNDGYFVYVNGEYFEVLKLNGGK